MSISDVKFSIVIPSYNRPARLEKCLTSISNLSYPKNLFEVIVVDDGSDVPIDSVAEQFKYSVDLSLLRQSNAGPASARNTGAKAAKGHYLVFTDDDCEPEPSWLGEIEAAFDKIPDALVGGYSINALSDNAYSTASQLLIDYLYSYFNQSKSQSMFFTSNNFSMPRKLFEEIGGFDTNFPLAAGEDREFCDRWTHHELPVYYVPSMRVIHAHNLTMRSFWRQHFNYGRGAYCFHKIRSHRQNESLKVEPVNFYIQLIAYPFLKYRALFSLRISMLFFISQVANVCGFFWERSQNKLTSMQMH